MEPEIDRIPPYLKVKEVMSYFRLDREKILRLLATGDIKGSKPGKIWIISRASVLKYLKRYENRSPQLNATI